jgi:hypothetical protein
VDPKRREFIGTGLGLGWLHARSAVARTPQTGGPAAAREGRAGGAGEGRGAVAIPHRKVKTTVLFRSPGMYPNGLAVAPEGLWIAQQKISVQQAAQWNQPVPKDRDEAAWLVDWNGKLLKTVMTQSRNTSGMAYGEGCVWMGANAEPWGFFQTDMNSKTVSHRQIPLGPANNGGGCHGAQWHNGKLWIYATRLAGLLRVDPKTWQPEFMIPIYRSPEISRYHDLTFDEDGAIWQMVGRNSTSFAENWQGVVKYDAATGRMLEIAEFLPGSADLHNLECHNGALIGCDAGLHPDWKDGNSPFSGAIFRIDFV